jgi:hypothetical protein
VKRPDGTWARPLEAEKTRLSDIAQGGPPGFARPPNCDPGAWFWLGRKLGWFACQDTRSFIFDAGKVTPKGKVPPRCHTLTTVAFARGEIYASCANGTLWKTDEQTWRPLPAPQDKGKEFGSISVTDKCVFVAGARTVWRSCDP